MLANELSQSIIQLAGMLPNSHNFVCGHSQAQMWPLSLPLPLQTVPFSFYRQTDTSFLYSDVKDQLASNISSVTLSKDGKMETNILQQFMGVYDNCCFGDDAVFLINKEGDIVYYDLVSKESCFIQKQHPSLFDPIQLHSVYDSFISCGGNVKSGLQENQMIIKLWGYQDEEVVSKARIVTGHTRAIENSLVVGESRVVSLSTDKSIRISNLIAEQLQQVVKVKDDYYSGCALDWSTILVGGQGKHLDIVDIRCKRLAMPVKLPMPVVQICEIARMTDSMFLLANVNQIYSLDIRSWQIVERASYEGQRISKIMALNKQNLVIGNRDKTLQVWSYV